MTHNNIDLILPLVNTKYKKFIREKKNRKKSNKKTVYSKK